MKLALTGVVTPYVCPDCGHALVLHEIDDDWQRAACCVDGCSCGHAPESKR